MECGFIGNCLAHCDLMATDGAQAVNRGNRVSPSEDERRSCWGLCVRPLIRQAQKAPFQFPLSELVVGGVSLKRRFVGSWTWAEGSAASGHYVANGEYTDRGQCRSPGSRTSSVGAHSLSGVWFFEINIVPSSLTEQSTNMFSCSSILFWHRVGVVTSHDRIRPPESRLLLLL